METNDFKIDDAEERRRAGIPAIVRAVLPRNLWENPLNWKRTKGTMAILVLLATVGPATAFTISKKGTPQEAFQVASLPSVAKSQPVSFNGNQQQANPQSAARIAFDQLVAETNGNLFEFKKQDGRIYATPIHVKAQWINQQIDEYFTVSQISLGLGGGGVSMSTNMGTLYNSAAHDCAKRAPGSPEFNRCDSQLKSLKLAVLAAESGVTLQFVGNAHEQLDDLFEQVVKSAKQRKFDETRLAIANIRNLVHSSGMKHEKIINVECDTYEARIVAVERGVVPAIVLNERGIDKAQDEFVHSEDDEIGYIFSRMFYNGLAISFG